LVTAIAAFSDVKPSLAWAETYPGTMSYYLASAFTEVWMQPSGSVGLIGFASNATFLRAALDKSGFKPLRPKSLDEIDKFIATDRALWAGVIKALNISLD